MYVRPISTRLFSGMLIPAMRAISCSPLPLLVTRVRADDEHPPWRRMILHFSHIGLTDGRTFIDPFRHVCDPATPALAAVAAAATASRSARTRIRRTARDHRKVPNRPAAPRMARRREGDATEAIAEKPTLARGRTRPRRSLNRARRHGTAHYQRPEPDVPKFPVARRRLCRGHGPVSAREPPCRRAASSAAAARADSVA